MADSPPSDAAQQLLLLGITESPQIAARALELADGDLERACNIIMEGRLDLTVADEAKRTTPEPEPAEPAEPTEEPQQLPRPEPELEPDPAAPSAVPGSSPGADEAPLLFVS